MAWHKERDRWAATKVLTIAAEPADPDLLPPALQPFGAVPPLITDIDQKLRWWPKRRPSRSSGLRPCSNIEGVPHSLVITVS